MMNDVTDLLLEDYLVENYTSKAAQNPADQAAAEKAFKDELVNGPEKMVHYASGSFPKKVGTFDLDNFHKAYDKYFEDNNLLDIFTDDGKLVNRGTYARFKDLDKMIPAVKALRQLWGVQFNRDMEFLADKLVRVKAEEDKAAAKAKLEQDREDCKTRFNDPQVLNKITSTKEWKDLIDAYPADMRDDIKLEVEVDFHYNDTLISKVILKVKGVIAPPVADANFGGIRVEDPEELSEADIIKQITDPKAVADMLVGIKRIIPAAMLMITNYEEYKKRPEAEIAVLNNLSKNSEWLIYYDRDNKVYYKTVQNKFPINDSARDGLMLVDLDNPNHRAGRLTAACVLVAARVDYTHRTSNCYVMKSYRDYYNTKWTNKTILDKLGIETKDREGNWNCDYNIVINDSGKFRFPELSNFFDKESYYKYECDSSD